MKYRNTATDEKKKIVFDKQSNNECGQYNTLAKHKSNVFSGIAIY
jgi:hypothetical protein